MGQSTAAWILASQSSDTSAPASSTVGSSTPSRSANGKSLFPKCRELFDALLLTFHRVHRGIGDIRDKQIDPHVPGVGHRMIISSQLLRCCIAATEKPHRSGGRNRSRQGGGRGPAGHRRGDDWVLKFHMQSFANERIPAEAETLWS